MSKRGVLWWIVAAIAAGTLVSGAVQFGSPRFVLGLVGGETTVGSVHFFRIVGMFMFLFGGMTLQTMLSGENSQTVLLWAALQKFGASGAVGWGVTAGAFSSLALGIAGFDLLSGILMVAYRQSVRSETLSPQAFRTATGSPARQT